MPSFIVREIYLPHQTKKVQFIIEHSYYSFGIDKEENLNEKLIKLYKNRRHKEKFKLYI